VPKIVGYHASHEQFPPSQLLQWVKAAEAAGFNGALASDHFYPWTEAQGQSGFVWSWLGAALATTSLPMGMVNAPGQRYHPAIIAQALATLAEMFPDRVFACLGSGQLLNEHITGSGWPTKAERNARLLECVQIIRALFAGETVNHRGRVVVEEARLYTRPARAPRLIGAALTEATAEWVGGWADGMITTSRPPAQLKKMVDAFRRGGGAGKPMYLKVQLSYAREEGEALRGALDQWDGNVFASEVITDLSTPQQFEKLSHFVTADEVRGHVRISADLAQQAAWLAADLQLGFEALFLHNVNREQARFIEDFGARVLPQLKG
jgi:coenzyme F420-dependent glucose-6-phosphate dehydrogenase